MFRGYHYDPDLALRTALHYELTGQYLTREQALNIDLDWDLDIALAQADLLFEAK